MYNVSTLVKGDLLLMINTAVHNDLKKENWTEDDILLYHNIKMKKDFSITHPVFTLKTQDGIWKYNYVYYADTQRFYFVDNITPLIGGCFELMCSVDVLMSFQQSIMNCMAFESRSSHIGSGYVADSKIIFNSAPKAKTFMFKESPSHGMNFKGNSFILGVANDGEYMTLDKYMAAKKYGIISLLNFNDGEFNNIFDWFEQHYIDRDIYYEWGGTGQTTVKEGRTVQLYDCSHFVDAGLVATYPNLPPAFRDYSTGGLGNALYAMYAETEDLPNDVPALIGIQPCSIEVKKINTCSIIFNMAQEGDAYGRDDTYFPAVISGGYDKASVLETLGITKNGVIVSDKNSARGYGHVMFYVGHMMYNKITGHYSPYDTVLGLNGEDSLMYHDMGDGWYFHIVGKGGGLYKKFRPNNLDTVWEYADGFVLLSQLTSTERVGGIFTPYWNGFKKLYGGS